MQRKGGKLRRVLEGKRFVFFSLFAVIFLGYATSRELWRRIKLEQEIRMAEEEIAYFEKQNQSLEQTLDYFNSSLWEEKQLRDRLNLRKEGETEIILPRAEKSREPEKIVFSENEEEEPSPWLWWNYFFTRKP